MTSWWRSLGNAFGRWTGRLVGRGAPTRIQKWVARHPVGAGLCMAVSFAFFFLIVSSEEESDGPVVAALAGLSVWLLFALTAAGERLRQRRLTRLGLWTVLESSRIGSRR
ncbi:hypothetical protein E5N77_36590 [Streptomyces sp. SS52]|nr:hypothetical protein E5N77_36590 [Streptomyces sp. SS52]